MKMEQNMPIIAKKFWKILRVAYFMLRKGISKGKILADLNLMLKRGKIAGKLEAIHNLMFHHHHHTSSAAADSTQHHQLSFPTPLNEYEFSCSNTPAHPTFHLPFHLNKRKHPKAAPPLDADLVAEALEIFSSATASPALSWFGPSPVVRQLRVTDSPYPLREIEEDNHVDEAAEEFIAKFYSDLKRQNSPTYSGS
ncbi:hypothetical protein F511_18663 [Dorcoceras hygrometricum]|uniref:Avr9/Cf-9 rapidly elicited protein 146 n=1 Tax=Dorcoceras hygrometricum TaxID=472368 RepID=A0A2Z7DG26_9LAMI|nr:hypothetical protein F511_18663 [Dorcoceras hygrometricum]